MKIQTEIIIDADRETVWRMIDNPDNMTKWQSTFTLEVTERRKPVFVAGTCDSGMGTAVIVNHFDELPDGKTKWTAYWNHTFRGFFRLLAPFKRASMARQVEDDLNRFKLFVESEVAAGQ